MNCNNCERRWQNGEKRKGCQVLLAKRRNCWAFTTDKDWENKVDEAVNQYSMGKSGNKFKGRGKRYGKPL